LDSCGFETAGGKCKAPSNIPMSTLSGLVHVGGARDTGALSLGLVVVLWQGADSHLVVRFADARRSKDQFKVRSRFVPFRFVPVRFVCSFVRLRLVVERSTSWLPRHLAALLLSANRAPSAMFRTGWLCKLRYPKARSDDGLTRCSSAGRARRGRVGRRARWMGRAGGDADDDAADAGDRVVVAQPSRPSDCSDPSAYECAVRQP
jgi:hypothetical protein